MCCDAGDLAPPLRTKLSDGECYFMLGNFNHHHQHAVIAGTSARYASTHRVALTQDATFDGIMERCAEVLCGKRFTRSASPESLEAARARAVGELAARLEFDWIRQFYCQGAVHAAQHSTWWAPRIDQLTEKWTELDTELRTMAEVASQQQVPLKALRMLIYLFESRLKGREEWEARLRDPTYKRIPAAYRPIRRPDCSTEGAFTAGMDGLLAALQARLAVRTNSKAAKVAKDTNVTKAAKATKATDITNSAKAAKGAKVAHATTAAKASRVGKAMKARANRS
mmetsp:Transcript_9405/g.23914  ORF Transcript_9405/g.23914 Transcript_9405/m.23914 type:complete len:283 (-) Transcript_9405:46-894(-)